MWNTIFLQNLGPGSPDQFTCEVSKLKVAINKGDLDTVEMLLDGGKYAAVRLVVTVWKNRMWI